MRVDNLLLTDILVLTPYRVIALIRFICNICV